jgi:hypothetical protein
MNYLISAAKIQKSFDTAMKYMQKIYNIALKQVRYIEQYALKLVRSTRRSDKKALLE